MAAEALCSSAGRHGAGLSKAGCLTGPWLVARTLGRVFQMEGKSQSGPTRTTQPKELTGIELFWPRQHGLSQPAQDLALL